MKLSRPIIPPAPENGSLADLLDGSLEHVQLTGDATKYTVQALEIDSVIFDRMSFLRAHLPRIVARDLVAKQSDFSSTLMTDGAFNRAEFINCRMSGVDFSKTSLHDVVFRGCKLDMANMRFADIRRAKFIDCTLVETDFLGAILQDVTFESCVLEKTVFDRVKCKQVDLRTSQLIELSGWGSLKGATIDGVQLLSAAPYLAHELGISVT